jgi:hypothetical protein
MNIIIIKLVEAFIYATIIFAIYVEVNPKLGNIWYRIDMNGDKQIYIINLFRLMFAPIYYIFYWYIYMWDINFFIYWIGIYMYVSYI